MPSRKKSWWYVSGAAVACAGVLVAANVAFARDHDPAVADMLPAAAPPAAGPLVTAPTVAPTDLPENGQSGAPDPAPSQDNRPLGKVIDTGIAARKGRWVFYLVPIRDKVLPKTHFGVML